MTARLLVTGSRKWDDADRIALVLKGVREQPHFSVAVLVHGGAQGADLLAAKAWADLGGTLQLYRAKWEQCVRTCPQGHRRKRGKSTYCPTAGHRRNAQMVDDGADLCLAFVRDGSKGTAGCISLAQRAGIPVLSELRRTGLQSSGCSLTSGRSGLQQTATSNSPQTRRRNGPVKARSESTHIPEPIRLAVLERDGYACQRCGISLYGIRYGLQHRRPRSSGGSTLLHTMANLVSPCGWVGDAGTCTHDVEVTDRLRATAEGWLLPHRFRLIDPEVWPVLRFGSRWEQSGDLWVPCEPHPRQLEMLGGTAA